MGRLRWQSSSSRKVLMVGGSGRTIELTGGRGGVPPRTFFAELFFRGGPGVKRLGRAPPRLAKRYCRLHGSTVSAKSQNLKKSTKVHPKWYQRRTLDAGKTHIEGALADGFHHIVALRPQAKEKCAKLCEKCPGKVPRAPKNEKQATKSAQTSTKMSPKSTK